MTKVAILAAGLLAVSACMKPVAVGGGSSAAPAVQGFSIEGAGQFAKVFRPATAACMQQEIRLDYVNTAKAAAARAWAGWAARGEAAGGRFSFEDVIIESHCHAISYGTLYCASDVELVAEMESPQASPARQQVMLQARGVSGAGSCGQMAQGALDKALSDALDRMVADFGRPAGATGTLQSSARPSAGGRSR
ncbi:MAG: hypothetical protein Kilf2KO_42170 [Rhodospirillales bacterium]